VGVWIDPIPGLDRVVLFLGAGVELPLLGGLGCSQLSANRRDEGLKVLNILLRSRRGVLSSFLGLSKPGNTLHANKLEPSRAQEGKGDFASARVYLRDVRSSREGQMTVPFDLMHCDVAPELPHQGGVISFHLPVGLEDVGRRMAPSYTLRCPGSIPRQTEVRCP